MCASMSLSSDLHVCCEYSYIWPYLGWRERLKHWACMWTLVALPYYIVLQWALAKLNSLVPMQRSKLCAVTAVSCSDFTGFSSDYFQREVGSFQAKLSVAVNAMTQKLEINFCHNHVVDFCECTSG